MGITSFSVELINKYKGAAKSVIELGAQNLYLDGAASAPYADKYYKGVGIKYACVDLNGENGALKLDLSKEQGNCAPYDLVTDFGTSEHVGNNGQHDIEAFYNCWLNKHNWCMDGGIIISENPKTGNWPGHGFNYVTKDFYVKLAEANGYKILELGEHPAMGNFTDGWNVYCALKKGSGKFMSLEEFKNLGVKTK